MPEIVKCSSCGRAIIWSTSPTGGRLPLTAWPVTVYFLDEEKPPVAGKLEISEKLYISHFVDCPNGAQHYSRR